MSQKARPAQFVVYGAIDIPAAHADHVMYRPCPKTGIPVAYVPKLGEDIEVCQFASEVPAKPISEKKFRAMMAQMTEAMLEKARSAGLVLA